VNVYELDAALTDEAARLEAIIDAVTARWDRDQQIAVDLLGVGADEMVPATRAFRDDGKPLLGDLVAARANVLAAIAGLQERLR
jgi:hypothetical protein